MHVYMHTCVHARMRACVRVHVRACMHAFLCFTLYSLVSDISMFERMTRQGKGKINFGQAGAELGQDHVMLDDIVEVLVEFLVKVLVEVEV